MVTPFLPSFLNPVKAEQEKGPRLRPGRRSKLMKTEKRSLRRNQEGGLRNVCRRAQALDVKVTLIRRAE